MSQPGTSRNLQRENLQAKEQKQKQQQQKQQKEKQQQQNQQEQNKQRLIPDMFRAARNGVAVADEAAMDRQFDSLCNAFLLKTMGIKDEQSKTRRTKP